MQHAHRHDPADTRRLPLNINSKCPHCSRTRQLTSFGVLLQAIAIEFIYPEYKKEKKEEKNERRGENDWLDGIDRDRKPKIMCTFVVHCDK